MGMAQGEGAKALALIAIEANRWLKKGMIFAALAGLKGLDPGRIENINVMGDTWI